MVKALMRLFEVCFSHVGPNALGPCCPWFLWIIINVGAFLNATINSVNKIHVCLCVCTCRFVIIFPNLQIGVCARIHFGTRKCH